MSFRQETGVCDSILGSNFAVLYSPFHFHTDDGGEGDAAGDAESLGEPLGQLVTDTADWALSPDTGGSPDAGGELDRYAEREGEERE